MENDHNPKHTSLVEVLLWQGLGWMLLEDAQLFFLYEIMVEAE